MSYESILDELIAHAARRAGGGSAPLVASLLATWSHAFAADPSQALGIEGRKLEELALCRRPREERWLDDVSELAAEFGMEKDKLVCFLRAAEAVERFRIAHSDDSAQSRRLLAARDRTEDD